MNERFDSSLAITAFIAATLGGAISYLKHTAAYSLTGAITALFMSGLSGFLCWLFCTALNLPAPLTAVCAGLAGHMGAELTRISTSHPGHNHAKH